MLRYSTKDIIARAEQLADLQNSDFISTDEKIALLNENFQILYQKIIDSNDKTWIKSVYIQDGMELPSDFYQLARVYEEDSNRDINKSTGRDKVGYDIKNNIITLHSNGSIVMDYYPEPPTLGLKTVEDTTEYDPLREYSSGEKRNLPSDYKIIGLNKNIIAVRIGLTLFFRKNIPTENYPTVWSTSAQTSRSYDALIFDNAKILYREVSNSSSEDYSYLYDSLYWEENGLTDGNMNFSAYIPYVEDNRFYILNREKKTLNTLAINMPVGTFDEEIDDNAIFVYKCNNFIYQISSKKDDFYYVVNGEKYSFGFNPRLYLQMFPAGNNLICHGLLEKSVVYILTPDGFKKVKLMNKIKGLIDNAHALVDDNYNVSNAIESISDDTLLSYPNNAYYTMLAYLLAVSFKMKQNGDPANLINKYSSIENQFFDSINRDVNESYIMNDVYKSGPLVW